MCRWTLSLDYGQSRIRPFRCRTVSPRERSRDKTIAVAFGERVRAAHLEAGMSQEALAEAAGLHPTFVSNVERGYRVPTIPTLIRLASGLRVAASALIDGIEP
jgi:ribosome-binding protein aMBF1 (putative translation factor)